MPSVSLLCCIFFASSGSYRASASAMGINESALFEAVDELTALLVELLPEVVTFPDSLKEWRQVEAECKRKQGITGVAGAVNGSLIAIQRPEDLKGFTVESVIQLSTCKPSSTPI
ncbi:hypothetical protein PR003_g25964 [Phytophthora rubi]|uniref:DDE Tnp4 domain-containing protein n=1 Tax=Phytophthora rubi TaxID=129364 RepID=A0A6A4CFS8_9STRA|nr:hypothetical protein PR003_g25964 [Phytophthora rubi]